VKLFTPLPFSTLAAVAAVAAALVVVFYILKLRRRPVPVPFSRIWQLVLRDKEATSLFSQLKRLLSLLLQLALLALLLLALADPRASGDLIEGRNLVVLVDSSASMQATDVAPSRIEVARAKVREMIRGLSGSDRMLIAQMDAAVTPLSTMTAEVSDLELAVGQIRAFDTQADLERALRFALDSLRGLSRPQIVVVGDGAYGELARSAADLDLSDCQLSFVPVGTSGQNAAITRFSVRRYPLDKSRYEVMLEVTNTNERPAHVELSLLGDGQVVDVTRLALRPKERLPRFYKDLAGASRTLEASIKPADALRDYLPADNHAYALMPERRRSRVLVVSPGNTYLEAALLLDEYLDVTLISPEDYPPSAKFDVTIFDGVAPPLGKHTGAALYLNPPAEGGPLKYRREIEMFGFDVWDRKHPVLRWMAMGDIQVAKGFAFDPEPEDKVIGASVQGPVLVAGRRAGRKFVALGFDPRNSDFVLRVAWPLFILNTINTFVEEDTGYISSYRTGDVWRIPAPSGAQSAILTDPSGRQHRVPVQEGRAVYLGDRAGFYKLSVPNHGESTESMFAANLANPQESQIEPVPELKLGSKVGGALEGFVPGVRRELWVYLLLVLVIVSVIEWFTYHRRITV
jgi:Ca-activated chloride channel family protein